MPAEHPGEARPRKGSITCMAVGFTTSPWESCSAEIREQIEAASSVQVIERGEHLYHDGEPAKGVYWLQTGILLIYNIKHDGRHVAALPCYRGLLGTPAVLAGSYRAHLKAVRTSSVRFTPASTIIPLMREEAFGQLLGSYTGEDFSVMLSLWGAATQQNSEKKLLDFLHSVFRLAAVPGDAPPDSLAWPFSVTEMADWLSLSRPHLSKLMNGLITQGEIELRGGRLWLKQ